MTDIKNRSPIDVDMLTMALQAGDLDTGWWLDTHTGEVIPEPDAKGSRDERATIASKQASPDRYVDIEPLPNDVMLALMESFVATLEDEHFCQGLYQALAKEQAAWHFKGALACDPAHEDSWYAFKEQFYALQARQWARDKGLEYEIKKAPDDFTSTVIDSHTHAGLGLLQLQMPEQNGYRRYEIRRASNDKAITLTAYHADSGAKEQVIAETGLTDQQLQGLNPILEQVTFDITGHARGQDDQPVNKISSSLIVQLPDYRIEVSGPPVAGGVPHQLATLFNVLLGLGS